MSYQKEEILSHLPILNLALCLSFCVYARGADGVGDFFFHPMAREPQWTMFDGLQVKKVPVRKELWQQNNNINNLNSINGVISIIILKLYHIDYSNVNSHNRIDFNNDD